MFMYIYSEKAEVMARVPYCLALCWLCLSFSSVWPAVASHLVLSIVFDIRLYNHHFIFKKISRERYMPVSPMPSSKKGVALFILFTKNYPAINMELPKSNMLKRERHSFIIKQINLHNKVLSTDLSIQLQVSEDTVRRDLSELADAKKVIKVHGGALSVSYHFPNQQNFVYAQEAKTAIAKKAVSLLRNGMIVLTEAGTTVMEMVKIIPKGLEATFFTVSPLIALELAEHPSLTVILIGGQMDMSSQICIGEKPVRELMSIRTDICFLGANAIDAKIGLTETEWNVVQVKKCMIEASSKLVVLTISEKLNSSHKMHLCKPNSIDYLVTELEPESKQLDMYRTNMKVL